MSIRVLIADDYAGIREALRFVFQDTDIRIVGEASSGNALVALLDKIEHVDVLVLDVKMPNGNGFETLPLIRMLRPKLPVLMFSVHDSPDYVQRSRALGANGYLLKGGEKNRVAEAVRSLHAGQSLWD